MLRLNTLLLDLRPCHAHSPRRPSPFPARQAAVSGQPLSAAADKYKAEIWDSLKALWMVWVPAQVRLACVF